MAAKEQNDFDDLLQKTLSILRTGKKVKSMSALGDLLGIPPTTLMSGFRRNFGVDSLEKIRDKYIDNGRKIEGADGERIEVDMEGNFGEVRAVDVRGQIRTVAQLLKAAQVDLSEWEPFEPTVKKWDVALKIKNGDVDELHVIPSFYVATRLRRIHPRAFEPKVSPVSITIPKFTKQKNTVKKGTIRRALIVNDPQVGFRRRLHTSELTPFHDRRVLDLALQVAQEEQIDHISFGGDCLDLSEWSNKFLPEPEFFWTTQPALIELAWWFAQFRAAKPNAEIKKMEGNHDARLMNLIVANMRQAYRLKSVDELTLQPALSVPRLLALHQLDIEYIGGYPDNGYFLNNNVYITHGDLVRSAPGATALELTRRQAFTTVFGHIHRRELVARRTKTTNGDLVYSAFCPGCACHVDGRVPGSRSDQQWQQGIAVIEYTDDEETIIPIPIQEGRMMYNGRIWQARQRDKEIDAVLTEGLEQVTA